jgi:hypothetical protein
MKRLLLALLGLLFVVSCGGGSSGEDGIATDPSLTLLNYTNNVKVGQSAIVDFGYSDSEGNINTLFIREQFNTKDVTNTSSAQVFEISGKSGSSYYEVWVTDANGNRSNNLSFMITVTY